MIKIIVLFFVLFPLNIYGQNIHEQIINEIGILTEKGQNELTHQFIRYSLANPKTKHATFNKELSILTLKPRLTDEMLHNYKIVPLLKKTLKTNGQVCDAPFINALTTNGFTLAIKLDLPEDMDKNTINELRFMPYTKQLVRQNPNFYNDGKPLDVDFWCIEYRSGNSNSRDLNVVLKNSRIYPLQGEAWYEKEWLSQKCIYNIDSELYDEQDIVKGMRQTALVREKIEQARSKVYNDCKKDSVQFVLDYLKDFLN